MRYVSARARILLRYAYLMTGRTGVGVQCDIAEAVILRSMRRWRADGSPLYDVVDGLIDFLLSEKRSLKELTVPTSGESISLGCELSSSSNDA